MEQEIVNWKSALKTAVTTLGGSVISFTYLLKIQRKIACILGVYEGNHSQFYCARLISFDIYRVKLAIGNNFKSEFSSELSCDLLVTTFREHACNRIPRDGPTAASAFSL